MLSIGYEYAGFAATTSTTKGGENTFNPSSVESKRDLLRYSDDGSQGSESDTCSRSNEHGALTSTEESSDRHFDFSFEFTDEKGSKAEINRASEQLRTEIRVASLPVRNEVFRLRSENKDLRGQICDTRSRGLS